MNPILIIYSEGCGLQQQVEIYTPFWHRSLGLGFDDFLQPLRRVVVFLTRALEVR